MDPSLISAVILFIPSLLIGVNSFFLRGLIKKIEDSDRNSNVHSTKIEMIGKQLDDLTKLREDVAVLKYAILGYLNKNGNKS